MKVMDMFSHCYQANPLKIFGSKKTVFARRVYCIGANYLKHVEEMKLSVEESPCYFMKPPDTVLSVNPENVASIEYPLATDLLHHEIELVVILGKEGVQVSTKDAEKMIYGCAVGLDLTRRDLQKNLRSRGNPWELAKVFEQAAPIGLIHKFSDIKNIRKMKLSLFVNGQLRQNSSTQNMRFDVAQIISNLSTFFHLRPGDLLFTGTPEGVGKLVKGDSVRAEIETLSPLNIRIT